MDLTTGKEWKIILRFAMPMLLGNVFQQLYNIIDSIIVGRYIGKEALAAVGASFPIIFVLISFVIGVASGSTIIISQYFGAKDIGNVKRTIDTMYIVLFFAAVLVTTAGIGLGGVVFKLIQLPPDVLPQALEYLHIYFAGIILFFGFNGTSAILRGLGDSKTPLYFLIVATILNALLDLLFVLVFDLGIAGVAYATLVSHGTAFIFLMLHLNRKHEIINLSFRKLIFDVSIFIKSIKIGLPSGLQQTIVALGMVALLRIVNEFGTDVIAAYSVAGRIDTFAIMPAMNFAMALSTFVGQNLGANKPERVRNGYRATLLMTTIVSLSVTAVVMVFGNGIMSVFTTDPEVISIGLTYLTIASLFYIVFTAMFITNGVMRGAGDTLIPMLITLIALWVVRIPSSYFLSREIGVVGIWWGIPAAWGVGAILSYVYYRTGRWKSKVVVKYN